ncbi:MAG TPA: HAMP domain-containing sensor histidine kinase [Chryseolinea sp.]|nr:HAMP domain-containing sensor histidine kinase [Chryseolinea sp.]HPH45778.1 HAMP domain-containing sensor histidine kinase [Chryseolinea sp.]HPM30390.1 HAMP domain-containing sensor histidine kinase [Chryseolinea sp.]
MKNSTIRLVVILAAISIVGITITQIYWVKRAFNLKEDEFERNVNTALYNVAQQVFEINKSPSPAVNPVKQLSTNYFVVMVNNEVNPNTLEFLLQTEFKRRNIIADFEYGVFDCTSEKMIYGDYVPLQTAKEKVTNKKLPTWANQGYYFGVQFPNREAQLLNQMGIWSFSSIVLLVVIFFFAYTLFIILKQRRLSEIQKDFINNMTHEFKTPISTIAISSQVLKDPQIIHQPERLLNYAEIIEKENTRLKQHVERVLQMARLEKEDIELKKESTDIHLLIKDAVKNVSHILQEKKGNITVDLCATLHEIEADKLHLTNVFTNLLDNAIKYCTTQPKISIRSFNQDSKIGIEITDNGMGIHSENQKKVFQKFYRVPTGNVHDVKGFGLGLSYVRSIVQAHRGEVKLFSEIGKGSTFSLLIPQSKI